MAGSDCQTIGKTNHLEAFLNPITDNHKERLTLFCDMLVRIFIVEKSLLRIS